MLQVSGAIDKEARKIWAQTIEDMPKQIEL